MGQPAPLPRSERGPELNFTPVPRRKFRHDGWTPERQKAFIEALAVTGCVARAARMVNISTTNCYELKRAPGAESFRRAWTAALDFSVGRLRDIAHERAVEGQLVPVFSGGKLMGFRRVYNDRLLMFCLRHYGQDSNGRRTTINYFSTRASAEAGAGASTGSGRTQAGSAAETAATTVRTVITGPAANDDPAVRGEAAAAVLDGFEGIKLDSEAEAAIAAALEACAARAREADAAYDRGGEAAALAAANDPNESFVRAPHGGPLYLGELEPPVTIEEFVPFVPGEAHWSLAGAEKPPELVRFEERQALKAGPGAAEAGADGSKQGGAGRSSGRRDSG